MSRIGKKPVAIPSGVEAKIEDGTLSVKGPKGTLSMGMSADMQIAIEEGATIVRIGTAIFGDRR